MALPGESIAHVEQRLQRMTRLELPDDERE
jgi:hypothetical protein